jgi:hypothetical protein
VSLQREQASVTRGHAAQWIVGAWAEGGNIPDAVVRLTVTPAGQKAAFTLGCGNGDGTGSCELGAVSSASAPRQLAARVTVPASATSVTSVRLTAAAEAPDITKDPQVSVAVSVTAPVSPRPSATASPAAASGNPSPAASYPAGNITSTLPVGSLPALSGSGLTGSGLSGSGQTLSPGGNAAGLFPALSPSSAASSPAAAGGGGASAGTRPLADTSALPQGTSVLGAQLAGLIALAIAFILTVARLSLRKRSGSRAP